MPYLFVNTKGTPEHVELLIIKKSENIIDHNMTAAYDVFYFSTLSISKVLKV